MKSKIIEAYKEENQEIFNKRLGIIFNGEDNQKPTIVENLIDGSPTAYQCAWLYESFIGGGGFEEDLSKTNLSDDPFTFINPNDLLYDVSESISRHQGVFIHVNYNFNYEKDSFTVIPYSLCRLGKKDSEFFSGKIAVSRKGWGRFLRREQIDVLNVYNPRPEVIQAQVDDAGGWEYYKGQVMFFKLSKKHTYPRSLIETAYTFADVENQLGLFYNGTVKRCFEDTTIIRHREFPNKQDQDTFEENIKKLSGVENASSKLLVQDDWDDERDKSGNFKFDTIKNETKPDKYEHFETSSSNYIRKAFKNIPPLLVDYVSGKLGHSNGDDMLKAQSIYNGLVAKDREKLEILFSELFRGYKVTINQTGNWKIRQYSILDDGTVAKTNELASQDEIRKNQAILKASVNGVNAIIAIQTSVVNGITEYSAAVAMLEHLFGYDTPTATAILGTITKKISNANPTN